MANLLWKLPVPSTALLGGGPVFEKRPGREVAIRFSYESENDDQQHDVALVFAGVEAFKSTYYRAYDSSMLEAYDRLVGPRALRWWTEGVLETRVMMLTWRTLAAEEALVIDLAVGADARVALTSRIGAGS
jgi:hypothetical protein